MAKVRGITFWAILFASLGPMVFAEAPAASSVSAASGGYQSYYAVEPDTGYKSPLPTYGTPAKSPSPVYGSPAAKDPSSGYGWAPEPLDVNSQYKDLNLDHLNHPDDDPFIKQRLFNTAVALTVPLFSFQLPQRKAPSEGLDLANQAIFGAFALFVVILVFAVPILFTKPPAGSSAARSNDKDGILNHLMNNQNVLNFMGADLTNKIGLDATKCLQKSICDAHRSPKKYGMLATPFEMFFPPAVNGTSEAKTSIFQLAAKDGKYTKKDCGKKYSCFFDSLDLGVYFVDWWKHAGDPNYVLEF